MQADEQVALWGIAPDLLFHPDFQQPFHPSATWHAGEDCLLREAMLHGQRMPFHLIGQEVPCLERNRFSRKASEARHRYRVRAYANA